MEVKYSVGNKTIEDIRTIVSPVIPQNISRIFFQNLQQNVFYISIKDNST